MNTIPELIISHMSLAQNIAKKRKRSVSKRIYFDELESAAYYGLVKAANSFNKNISPEFHHYAKVRIRGEIEDYIRQITRHNAALLDFDGLAKSNQDKELANDVLTSLPYPINNIFYWYYLSGLKMKEIAKKLNVSESRISYLIREYKKKIRELWS